MIREEEGEQDDLFMNSLEKQQQEEKEKEEEQAVEVEKKEQEVEVVEEEEELNEMTLLGLNWPDILIPSLLPLLSPDDW